MIREAVQALCGAMSEERSMEGDFDSSVTDATPFTRSNQVAPQQLVAPNPGTKLRDEEYNMRHPRRGIALIFNHYRFEEPWLKPRQGTQKDCDDLSAVLTTLGFEVIVHHDLPFLEIKKELVRVQMMDHTDADCLLVAVMTHGHEGNLEAYDNPYPVDFLSAHFIGEKCPSLVGKPKIFIIQACRGDKLDAGVPVLMDSHRNTHHVLPIHADVLHVYSAPEGHFSWRNTRDGSWLIQALVRELTDLGRTRDLLTILTFVNQRVAIDYETFNTKNPEYENKKIIPSFTSMLTRLLYFR